MRYRISHAPEYINILRKYGYHKETKTFEFTGRKHTVEYIYIDNTQEMTDFIKEVGHSVILDYDDERDENTLMIYDDYIE